MTSRGTGSQAVLRRRAALTLTCRLALRSSKSSMSIVMSAQDSNVIEVGLVVNYDAANNTEDLLG